MATIKRISDDRVTEFARMRAGIKTWLEEVLSVKLSPNLHYDLKNGVVLCFLMNELDPTLVLLVEKPDQPLRAKQNISAFLKAAQDFGVPPFRLFEVGDLWDGTQLVLVVECLVEIAKIAAQKGCSSKYEPSPVEPELTDDEIVVIKKQMATIKVPTNQRFGISESLMRRKLSYLAGDPHKLENLERAITQLQLSWKVQKARKELAVRARAAAYRKRVVDELLATETDYVRNLDLCVKIYLNPLKEGAKKGKGLISTEDIHIIFSDVETILMCNQQFLLSLQDKVSKWSPCTCIGKIFIDMSHYFKVYANFVVNFSRSAQLINKISKKSSAFANYLKDCHDRPEMKKLDLPSLLIMPVQRIPRYSLLLKDILKSTWKDHPDHDDLVVARDKVDEVATYLNEKKREAESIASYLKLTENFVFNKDTKQIVNGSRKLLKNGNLVNEKGKEVGLYIFNDVLIWGRSKRRDLVVKEVIPVEDASIDSCANVKKLEFGFQLVKKEKITARFFCKSDAERVEWVSFFKTAKPSLLKGADLDKDSAHPVIPAADLLLMRMQQKAKAEGSDRSESYQEFQKLLRRRELINRLVKDYLDLASRKKPTELPPTEDLIQQIDELNRSLETLSQDTTLSPETRSLIAEARLEVDLSKSTTPALNKRESKIVERKPLMSKLRKSDADLGTITPKSSAALVQSERSESSSDTDRSHLMSSGDPSRGTLKSPSHQTEEAEDDDEPKGSGIKKPKSTLSRPPGKRKGTLKQAALWLKSGASDSDTGSPDHLTPRTTD